MYARSEQINNLCHKVGNESSYTAIQNLIQTYTADIINGKDQKGMTALHHACARLNNTAESIEKSQLAKNIITLLLRHGAKATLHNNDNQVAADILKDNPAAAAWLANEITSSAATTDDLLVESPTGDLLESTIPDIERHDQDHIKLNTLFVLLNTYTQKNKTNPVEYILAGMLLVPGLMVVLDKYDLLPITHTEHMNEHPARPSSSDWVYVGFCLFIAIGYSAVTYLSSKKTVDTAQVKQLRDELENAFGILITTHENVRNDDVLLSNLATMREDFIALQQYLGQAPLTEVVIAADSDDEYDDDASVRMSDRIQDSYDAMRRQLAKKNKHDVLMETIHSLHLSVWQFRQGFISQPHPLAFFTQPTSQSNATNSSSSSLVPFRETEEETPPSRMLTNQ
jgi:hypothetical protein